MRVAHIIKIVRAAGAERHLLTLLAGLRKHDIDARLILLVEPNNPMQTYVDEASARGIPVERLMIHRDLDPSLFKRLREYLRNMQPDVVHTHLLHADLYGIPAARWADVPVVVSSRHNDNTFRRRFPIRQVNQLLWRMADGGVAISDAIARFTVEVEGAPKAKIQRIHYGLEAAKPLDRAAARTALLGELNLPHPLAPSPNSGRGNEAAQPVLIGIACRLIEQKGVTYAIQAFARVAERFPNAHLLIAGEGDLRAALEKEAALKLQNRIHFLGWRDDIPAFMAALDIFLSPSLWEGFGLVLLEAMAQAVPIIGSAVSAIPEIVVNGETGLLVPPRDVTSLTDALDQLLADKPLRQFMGMQGQDRVETRFSAARMVDETAALYHTLLDMK
jgi:glycosyltransferase involved in cell wall biosynthesis